MLLNTYWKRNIVVNIVVRIFLPNQIKIGILKLTVTKTQ